MEMGNPIPFETAKELCQEYRDTHGVEKFTQCWGCLKYSRQDPEKMCFHNGEDNRGCPMVNHLFDERLSGI